MTWHTETNNFTGLPQSQYYSTKNFLTKSRDVGKKGYNNFSLVQILKNMLILISLVRLPYKCLWL